MRPLCRYCGKPLKKRVDVIIFNHGKGTWHHSGRPERPTSREDAQKLFNQEITHVKFREDDEGRFVSEASIWDGQSYVSKYFCKNDHAISFAHGVLNYKPELGTKDYHKAVEEQEKKAGISE